MRKTLPFLLTLVAVITLFACKQAPKADKAEGSEAQAVTPSKASASTLELDTEKSMVTWIGTKPTGQHNGTIGIKSGTVAIDGGKIVSGNFTMDMNSVKAVDMSPEYNDKLSNHLKDSDFFEVAKYPEAKFEITKVADYSPAKGDSAILKDASHMVSGNLTIKGQSKNITFPAKIRLSGNNLAAKANFNIDRTQWGLVYGNDKSLGDKFIRPEVNVGFTIISKSGS